MKKAVVYMLTAMVITSSCLTPAVAFAAEETQIDSKDSAVSNEKQEAKDKQDTSNSKDNSDSSEKTTVTPSPDENKGDETDAKDETDKTDESDKQEDAVDPEEPEVPEEPEKSDSFPVNENLSEVKKYIHSVDDVENTIIYIIQKDCIILGFNAEDKDLPEESFDKRIKGVINSKVEDTDNGYKSVRFSVFGENNELDWHMLDDFNKDGNYSADTLSKYVKEHIKDFSVVPNNKDYKTKTGIDSSYLRPDLLLFFTPEGDYIGTADLTDPSVNATLLDENITDPSIDTDINVSLSEDKKKATLDIDFAFDFPEVLGGEQFVDFSIYEQDDVNRENPIVSDYESLTYCNDVVGKESGKISGVPMRMNGKYILYISGTQQEYSVTFEVSGIDTSLPEQPDASDVVPKISFSDLGSGILDGTPVSITMYSDIDAVLTFNSESSVKATKQYSFTVKHNGTYEYTATTPDGGVTKGTITVSCFTDDVKEASLGTYNTDGTTFLPQTGGVSSLAVIISGIFTMIGGIAIVKKDKLMSFVSGIRKKV